MSKITNVKKYVKVYGDIPELRGKDFYEVIAEVETEAYPSGLAIVVLTLKGTPVGYDSKVFETYDKD